MLENIVGRPSIPHKIPTKPPNLKGHKSTSKPTGRSSNGPRADLLKGQLADEIPDPRPAVYLDLSLITSSFDDIKPPFRQPVRQPQCHAIQDYEAERPGSSGSDQMLPPREQPNASDYAKEMDESYAENTV